MTATVLAAWGRDRWSARPRTAPAFWRATSAAARSSRRRMPRRYICGAGSPASVSPEFSSSSVARARDALPAMREPSTCGCSPGRLVLIDGAYCAPVRMMRRTVSASFTTSCRGWTRGPHQGVRILVERIRTAVVLPAHWGRAGRAPCPLRRGEILSSARTLAAAGEDL